MSAIGAKSLNKILEENKQFDDIFEVTSKISYGSLATCNLIIQTSFDDNLFEKDILHFDP